MELRQIISDNITTLQCGDEISILDNGMISNHFKVIIVDEEANVMEAIQVLQNKRQDDNQYISNNDSPNYTGHESELQEKIQILENENRALKTKLIEIQKKCLNYKKNNDNYIQMLSLIDHQKKNYAANPDIIIQCDEEVILCSSKPQVTI